MISSCCYKSFNILKNVYNNIINKYSKQSNKNPEYIHITTNSNNEEKPAKILSSEEINEMINAQKKYSQEQSNTNGYKIIKQKNTDDIPKTGELLNLEEIKNEINQIEFEEEEQKKKKKKEKNIDNTVVNGTNEEEKNNAETIENIENEEEDEVNDENINIEELRKDVLESNDDDDE